MTTEHAVRITSQTAPPPEASGPPAAGPANALAAGLRQLRVSGTLARGQVAHVGPVSLRYAGHKVFIRFGGHGEIVLAPIDRHRAALDAIGLVDLPVVFEAPPPEVPLVRTGSGGQFCRDLTESDLTPASPESREATA